MVGQEDCETNNCDADGDDAEGEAVFGEVGDVSYYHGEDECGCPGGDGVELC